MDRATALALLDWQIELGVTEAIGDSPVNRYEFAEVQATAASAPAQHSGPTPHQAGADPIAEARKAASGASGLEDLALALGRFEHCELRRGARNLVFSDGLPGSRVMVIGEAPGREEDIRGKPFVGAAGQLLDKMFACIGLGRSHTDRKSALYITNVLPWRPPQNRDPAPEEIAMMLPFVERHVALAEPEILVLMGNHACQALLGRKGITRLRGTWAEALGRPALPMFHPAYLLRNPAAKREAWADLLNLQERLRQI